MTKKILAVSVLALLSLASCSKQRQCKCVTTDVADDGLLKVLVVDNGIKCEDIKEMGFEKKDVDTATGQQTLTRYEMHTVSCRDYDN